MPQMSKLDLYAAIRRGHRDGMAMRKIERNYNVADDPQGGGLGLAGAEEEAATATVALLEPYKPVIDGILRAGLDAPALWASSDGQVRVDDEADLNDLAGEGQFSDAENGAGRAVVAEVRQVALRRRRGVLPQVHHVQNLRDDLLPGDSVVVQDRHFDA